MLTREDIFARREAILALARQHGAYDIQLFGSVARGDNREDSDVDFLVRFEKGRSLFDHGGLLMDLRDLLDCKVDVIDANGMRPRFRDAVTPDLIPL